MPALVSNAPSLGSARTKRSLLSLGRSLPGTGMFGRSSTPEPSPSTSSPETSVPAVSSQNKTKKGEDPYIEGPVIQVPPSARESNVSSANRVSKLNLAEGASIEYYSKSQGCWIPAVVTSVDGELGAIKLDVKPSWINIKSNSHLLRPRVKPTREKMLEVLEVFRAGLLPQKSIPIFQHHARQLPGGELGKASSVILLEDLPFLAQDLDAWLGISCSITALRSHFKPGCSELRLHDFQEICWSLLWWLNAEYCHLLVKKDTLERSSRNPKEVLHFERRLGEGTYGTVMLATDKKTADRRAVKIVKKDPHRETPYTEEQKQRYREQLAREVEHLQMLDHPHILRLYEHFEDDDAIYLVTEFCSGGELTSVVQLASDNKKHLPLCFVAEVMQQVLMGISHVHSRGLVHLDLKGGNIMLLPSSTTTLLPGSTSKQKTMPLLKEIFEQPHAVIIDLGVSQIFKPGDFKLDRPYGTPATMAPEVWVGTITPKADIWSLGAVLFELVSLSLPFKVPFERKEAVAYWKTKPKVPWGELQDFPDSGHSLGRRMLHLDRHRRPTAKECLFDPFFAECLEPQATTAVEDGDGAEEKFPSLGPADLEVAPTLPSHFAERLANYQSRCMLEKCVRINLARAWAPHKMPSIKTLFMKMDVTGMGRLNIQLVCKSLVLSGISQQRAQSAVDSMVLSSDGFIGWTEFVAAVVDLGEARFDHYLRSVFDEADEDRDELLGSKDIAYLLTADDKEDKVLVRETMVALCGRDSDGARVDWKTFRRYFRTRPGEGDANQDSSEEAPANSNLLSQLRSLEVGGENVAGEADDGRSFADQVQAAWDWISTPAEVKQAAELKILNEKLLLLKQMGFEDRQRCEEVLRRHKNVVSDAAVQELISMEG